MVASPTFQTSACDLLFVLHAFSLGAVLCVVFARLSFFSFVHLFCSSLYRTSLYELATLGSAISPACLFWCKVCISPSVRLPFVCVCRTVLLTFSGRT